MAQGFREQLERARRCRGRLKVPPQAGVDYEDEFIAFFMHCWHLKDWIKNDTSVPEVIRTRVESDVAGYEALLICADLANASKHLVLTAPRAGAAITGKAISVDIYDRVDASPTEPLVAIDRWDFRIDVGGGESRLATDVADAALRAWDELIATWGL